MNVLTTVSDEHARLVSLLNRREILRAGTEIFAAEGDVVWMAENFTAGAPARNELVLVQVQGARTGLLSGLHVPEGLGLTGKVHLTGSPALVDDYSQAEGITHTFDRQIAAEGVHRLLAVPVQREGQIFGVMAVGARTDRGFGDRAVERAIAVADEVALAVVVAERARLAREVAVHEERARLATELHDTVGALLFAIGSGVAGLSESTPGDPTLEERVKQLQQQASQASSALRDALRALRASPSALEYSVALRADCSAFTDRTGVPAEFVLLDDNPPAMAPSRTRVLIAAVREALLNVEKYARASAVVVTISQRPSGGIVVAVTDDGVGLPPDHKPGIGLTTTAEALGRLGGIVRVASDADGGTAWRAELPC
ncbi:GAF domain-containing sensor histidine kinase [Nocardia macrotermitis]|uniref:Oxygen sensor histidine kinase NreB n=1 Tax=Nocardia macrotermitis TaxID=2585198 RepID=A0A7K0CZS5_9NOCA|nr:histidine kinase [Nocardia macrotermitis]MQY18969.1 hypothetical protein [Nocardia macrotermitis]